MWLSVADTGIGIEKDKLANIRKYLNNIFLLTDTSAFTNTENDMKNYADGEIKRKW